MSDTPTSVWQGSFMLGDLEMRCHVLSDGRRIIEAECMEAFFAAPLAVTQEQVSEFVRWFRSTPPPASERGQ